MKKEDVKIDGEYAANVSGQRVVVRIDRESRHGGWDATNLRTNRAVRIKTARRLLANGCPKGGRKRVARAPVTKPRDQVVFEPRTGSTTDGDDNTMALSAREVVLAPVPEAQLAAAKPTGRMSALSAAAVVLAASPQPMNCKELIAAMQAQGLWTSPGGKTPEATLHAAITRTIKERGEAARFAKVARGRFAVRQER